MELYVMMNLRIEALWILTISSKNLRDKQGHSFENMTFNKIIQYPYSQTAD